MCVCDFCTPSLSQGLFSLRHRHREVLLWQVFCNSTEQLQNWILCLLHAQITVVILLKQMLLFKFINYRQSQALQSLLGLMNQIACAERLYLHFLLPGFCTDHFVRVFACDFVHRNLVNQALKVWIQNQNFMCIYWHNMNINWDIWN